MGGMKLVGARLLRHRGRLHGALAALVSCLALGLSACTTGQTHALIGAVYAPPFRTPPPEMQKLCDEHDGMKIYRTADNVAGFVDKTIGVKEPDQGCGNVDSCWTPLNSGTYRFIEAAASEKFINEYPPQIKPYRSSGYLGSFVEQPGLYRFTLEKLGHPNCRIFERWHTFMYANLVAQGKRQWRFPATCIATWPIERFTARYELREHHISRERSYGRLHTFVKQVVDRHGGTLMAEYRHHFIHFYNRDGSVHCVHDRNSYVGWKPARVIRPAQGNS